MYEASRSNWIWSEVGLKVIAHSRSLFSLPLPLFIHVASFYASFIAFLHPPHPSLPPPSPFPHPSLYQSETHYAIPRVGNLTGFQRSFRDALTAPQIVAMSGFQQWCRNTYGKRSPSFWGEIDDGLGLMTPTSRPCCSDQSSSLRWIQQLSLCCCCY